MTTSRRNVLLVMTAGLWQTACSTLPWQADRDDRHVLIVSVSEQKMVLFEDGKELASYPISTAKNGIGDAPDSYMTPGGRMEIAEKFGGGEVPGTVFKDRMPNGEVVAVDAPGRDPVVTRILWLRGLEPQNQNAYRRFIYIHGTPQENLLGSPVSFGCIRMRSSDIVSLYERVGVGAQVLVK